MAWTLCGFSVTYWVWGLEAWLCYLSSSSYRLSSERDSAGLSLSDSIWPRKTCCHESMQRNESLPSPFVLLQEVLPQLQPLLQLLQSLTRDQVLLLLRLPQVSLLQGVEQLLSPLCLQLWRCPALQAVILHLTPLPLMPPSNPWLPVWLEQQRSLSLRLLLRHPWLLLLL